MTELKKTAVIIWAKINGIPEKRIRIETKKWNPGGVERTCPPMWYGFHKGSFSSSRIKLIMLPWSPISELGGYSLWNIMATLNRIAKAKMAKSSKFLLCFVITHHQSEYNYPFRWKKFIAFPIRFYLYYFPQFIQIKHQLFVQCIDKKVINKFVSKKIFLIINLFICT